MNTDTISHTTDPAAPYGTTLPRLTPEQFDETIRMAVETYGEESQTKMLFEEMAELQNAICKLSRERDTADHVCEEIADVMIMCLQMAEIYGAKAVEDWANLKIARLRCRLNAGK